MINILPQPKQLQELGGFTGTFRGFFVQAADAEVAELCRLRFWNHPEYVFSAEAEEGLFPLQVVCSLNGITCDKPDLLAAQG